MKRAETPDKDSRTIRAMFSSISKTYDLSNRVLSAGRDVHWRRRALEFAAIKPGARVIDLGTGTGDLAFALLARSSSSEATRVVGIDFARPMLDLARAKARGKGFAQDFSLVQADALALPFRDHVFDWAMGAFSLRNFADLDIGLAACRRVLKPGGRFLVLEFLRPERLAWPVDFYLRRVLPVLGGAVSGNTAAYSYLRDSQRAFLSRAEADRLFETAGFVVVGAERLAPGVAHAMILENRANPSAPKVPEK